jgi:DNA ligase-1
MKPHLACDADIDKMKFPCWGFPKIDGVRLLNIEGNALARSLKPHECKFITNKYSNDLFAGFDGELTVGETTADDVLNKTSSATRTINWQGDITWNLFDWIPTKAFGEYSYEERYNYLVKYINNLPEAGEFNIRVIPYVVISSVEEALSFYVKCLDEGFEGAIFRSPTAKHKDGRCTAKEGAYLRMKPQSDKESVVLSVYEAMENQNEAKVNELGRTERSSHKENLVGKGMLGGMICKDIETGLEINVGPGKMKHSEREYFWLQPDEILGKIIKYRSMDKGVKDLPRFPRFIDFRSERDM